MNQKAHISLSIYSKTGDTTAYSLATNDHAIREKYASTKYSTLTPVSETGTNSYKYTQTISGFNRFRFIHSRYFL